MKRLLALMAVIIISLGALWLTFGTNRNSDDQKLSIIHTVSYSNAAIFYLLEKQPGTDNRVFIPDPSKHVEALLASGSKKPIVSVTPFSNALIAISKNPELVIIAGAGLNGLSLLSSAGKTLDDLIGKKIGTSRGDSLEVFAYEAMGTRKYTFIYFTDPNVIIEAARKKEIDAATHVEPFATELVDSVGMYRVMKSSDLWGDHPDAVILTTRSVISKYKDKLKNFIDRSFAAENAIKADPAAAAKTLASFYGMKPERLVEILGYQEPHINIRMYEPFFEARLKTLKKMGYIDVIPEKKQIFDWSLISEAKIQ